MWFCQVNLIESKLFFLLVIVYLYLKLQQLFNYKNFYLRLNKLFMDCLKTWKDADFFAGFPVMHHRQKGLVWLIIAWRQRQAESFYRRMAAVGIHRASREEGSSDGAERIVPWGVLGLKGLLRACCARWWATSTRGSHKAQVASGAKRSQGKGHQEARERKQGRTGKAKERKKQKTRLKKGQTKRTNYGPGEPKGIIDILWCIFILKECDSVQISHLCCQSITYHQASGFVYINVPIYGKPSS